MKTRVVAALIALTVAAGSSVAIPWSPAVAQQANGGYVAPATDPIPNQYIVTLRDTPGGAVDVPPETVADRHDADIIHVYSESLDGFSARMTASDAAQLAADPAVASVEQDGFVHASVDSPQSPTPSWGLDRIDQSALPLNNTYTFASKASDVHAYVIDTGIHFSNPDFGGRAVLGVDEVTPSLNGDDCAGHGTHVAGTIGGDKYGVAKDVQLISVRVLNCSGQGAFSDVIAGVDWVTANAQRPAVANMSLGGATSTSLDSAVQTSIASGITYALAAGNNNGANSCNFSPSRVGAALTVGATDSNDARASFSNIGTCLDLFAPGVAITSDSFTSDVNPVQMSGTSMAAPHVAGVAALYLSTAPCATPAEVAGAITSSAASGRIPSPGTGSPNLLLNMQSFGPSVSGQVPCAPAVSATAGLGSVHLAWTEPASFGSPITGYEITRGTSSGGETHLTTLLPTELTFDDAVAVGSTYFYVVTATNSQGASPPAPEVSATPGPLLTTSPVKLGAHLSWSIPAGPFDPPVTGFSVRRGTASGGEDPTPIAQLGANARSFDDSGLSSSSTYFYTVAVVHGSETLSNEQSVVPSPATPPGPPTLTAASRSTGAHLTWSPPADTGGMPIVGYKVYRGASAGTGSSITPSPLPASQTTFDDTGLTNGESSFYTVTALTQLNGSTESARSNEVKVVPSAALDAVVRGTDSSVWWRHFDGATWGPWTPLGGLVKSDVSVVSGGGRTWIFATGLDDAVWFRRFNGSTWSPWTGLGGVVTSNIAAVYAGGTKVRVFVRGGDNALYTSLVNDTATQGWQGLGGVIAGDPAAVWDGTDFTVAVRGGDNAGYRGRYTGANVWQGWTGLGGVLGSDPAVALDGSTVRVFVQGGDSRLYVGSGAPFVWTGLGGVITGRPAVAPNGASGLRVFVRGGDNHVYTRASSGGAWPLDFQALGNTISSAPAAVGNGAGNVVAARGIDNGLWVGGFTQEGWQGWASLGGAFNSVVGLGATP